MLLLTCSLVVAAGAAGSIAVYSQARETSGSAVIYEGARLIIGDASAPIEDGAFVVQGGQIASIGRKGAVRAPAGATRADLTGKTVMPAMVNAHAHIGYEKFVKAAGESLPESFTPENIHDHLQRQAFYGVGAVLDAGSAAPDIALQYLSDADARKFPPAARFVLMAGVVAPNGGPDSILIRATRPLRASFEVTRGPEARAAVQLIAGKNIRHIKIWLGDRGGSYPAMPRQVYEPVVEEAHKHGIKVHAHAHNGGNRDLRDALTAGVDVVVHVVQNEKLDDATIALLKEKRPYWAPVMGLLDHTEVCDNDPFFTQILPAVSIKEIQANNCQSTPPLKAREENVRYNFTKMIESGARLVLGTDAGVFPRYTFGSSDHHEIELYVKFGLTPAQALVAASSRAAELIGIKDGGTLAAGMRADFIVLNANPLDDIRNTRQIASVYLNGAMLDRNALLAHWKRTDVSRRD